MLWKHLCDKSFDHSSMEFMYHFEKPAPSSVPRGIVGNFLGLSNNTKDKVQNDVE